LPGLQGRDSAYGQATALLAAEKPVAATVAPPVDASGRSVARVPVSGTSSVARVPVGTTSTVPTPVSAPTTVSAATPAVAMEPAPVAVDPVAEQPAVEPAPTTTKQAKKPHHRTVRHNDHYGNWRARYADPRYDMGFPRYSYR